MRRLANLGHLKKVIKDNSEYIDIINKLEKEYSLETMKLKNDDILTLVQGIFHNIEVDPFNNRFSLDKSVNREGKKFRFSILWNSHAKMRVYFRTDENENMPNLVNEDVMRVIEDKIINGENIDIKKERDFGISSGKIRVEKDNKIMYTYKIEKMMNMGFSYVIRVSIETVIKDEIVPIYKEKV